MMSKKNTVRINRFAQALVSPTAEMPVLDAFAAVLKSHIQITGTELESVASQRSDLILNMLHFLAAQPQFAPLAKAECRSAAQRSALVDGLKSFLQSALQGSAAGECVYIGEKNMIAVEKFWQGFAANLLHEGVEPLDYLDFKMFEFIDEVTECWERSALFGSVAH